MNWLAHLRLAPEGGRVRLGCLAGDFVRGLDLATLDPEIRRGVLHHRAVDRFVDAHPLVVRSRNRIAPPLRRFAGVLVDVFCDHFLARDWGRYGDGGALSHFVTEVHADLDRCAASLPPELRAVAPRFERHRWLLSYASVDGIDGILRSMSRRLTRENALGGGAAALRGDYEGFAADFAALWPELVAFAASVCGRTQSQ